MSSPRAASEFDGVLKAQHKNMGPIKLPMITAADFVRDFNHTYARIGLKIESILDLNRKDTPATEADSWHERT